MKKALTIGLVLCIAMSIAVASASALSDSGGGTWQYQRGITIHENSGETLTDYQVLVELSGSDFPTEAQSDGDDIRFTDASETELSYWIEKWNAGAREAKILVQVPLIPAHGKTEITMHYGNPSASAVSDGDATFEFFDDFDALDTDRWESFNTGSTGSVTASGGCLVIEGEDNACRGIKSKTTVPSNGKRIVSKYWVDSGSVGDGDPTIGFWAKDTSPPDWVLPIHSFCISDDEVTIINGVWMGVNDGSAVLDCHTGGCFSEDYDSMGKWTRFIIVRIENGFYGTMIGEDGTTATKEWAYTGSYDFDNVNTPAVYAHNHVLDVKFDWVYITKYAAQEPTISLSPEHQITTPSLVITKTASASTIKAGETITITIEIENKGDGTATDVSVSDTIPQEFQLISGSITEDYDTIKPSEYRTYQYTLKATETGIFVLDPATAEYSDEKGKSYSDESESVTINVLEPEPTPEPTSTVTPTPTPTPTLEVGTPQITISHTTLVTPEIGEETLIMVSIENTGNGDAKNIKLRERIPSGLSIDYVEGADSTGNLVSWDGDLKPAQTHSIKHSLKVLTTGDKIIPVEVTYEDIAGEEDTTSTTIVLEIEPETPTATPTPTVTPTPTEEPEEPLTIPWVYIIILVAVILVGLAIIVAARRGGEGGGAEVTIEEKK